MSSFPNIPWTIPPGLEANLIPEQGYDMATSMAPPLSSPPQLPLKSETSKTKRRRAPKAPTKSQDEWEAHRDNIRRLYVDENLPLKGVMTAMAYTYKFHASRIQYGSKIKEWGFQKNIRENHMRAIARKKLTRQSGDPSKASTFRLRSQPVPEQKIDRYMRANGLDEDTIFSDAPTPSDISCETPSALAVQSPGAVSTLLIDKSVEITSDGLSPAFFEDSHPWEVPSVRTLYTRAWIADRWEKSKQNAPNHFSTLEGEIRFLTSLVFVTELA